MCAKANFAENNLRMSVRTYCAIAKSKSFKKTCAPKYESLTFITSIDVQSISLCGFFRMRKEMLNI